MHIDLTEGLPPEECETMDFELDDDAITLIEKYGLTQGMSFEDSLKELLLNLFENLSREDGEYNNDIE